MTMFCFLTEIPAQFYKKEPLKSRKVKSSTDDKMKSDDSLQKDHLARNMLANLEINNKNEVSSR